MRWLDTFAATAAALTDANVTDELCCVFAHAWLVRYYGAAAVARAPLSAWMLYQGTSPWGPAEAVATAGLGSMVDDLAPGRWHRVQGWRGTRLTPMIGADGKPATGHTITVYAAGNGQALVFDSAKSRNDRVQRVTWASYAAQYTGGMRIAVMMEPS